MILVTPLIFLLIQIFSMILHFLFCTLYPYIQIAKISALITAGTLNINEYALNSSEKKDKTKLPEKQNKKNKVIKILLRSITFK